MIEGAPNIAAQLREARIRAGISCTRLATKIGCDRKGLWRWELVETVPSLQNATDWANALGYSLVLTMRQK